MRSLLMPSIKNAVRVSAGTVVMANPLFGPEGDQWVNARRPARGEIAGEQGDPRQQRGDPRERRRIARSHPEQLMTQQLRGAQCGGAAGDEPDEGDSDALREDQGDDLTPPRS